MASAGETIYKKTELVGTSTVGYDDAVKAAIGRAQKTLRHVDWFEVKELRGRIDNGAIVYQATLRDPVVLAGVVVAMSLLGLVATWIPAQRALSIEPSVLLREE